MEGAIERETEHFPVYLIWKKEKTKTRGKLPQASWHDFEPSCQFPAESSRSWRGEIKDTKWRVSGQGCPRDNSPAFAWAWWGAGSVRSSCGRARRRYTGNARFRLVARAGWMSPHSSHTPGLLKTTSHISHLRKTHEKATSRIRKRKLNRQLFFFLFFFFCGTFSPPAPLKKNDCSALSWPDHPHVCIHACMYSQAHTCTHTRTHTHTAPWPKKWHGNQKQQTPVQGWPHSMGKMKQSPGGRRISTWNSSLGKSWAPDNGKS